MTHAHTIRTALTIGAIAAASAGLAAQRGSAVTTAPQPAAPVARAAVLPRIMAPLPVQGFSVVLVLGDLQGGSTPDNVPAAARKALADMKDFLPYKSYRLLDAAWILGSSSLATRLRGPDDQDWSLTMSASATADPNGLQVTFNLRDGDFTAPRRAASTAGREEQIETMAAQKAELEHRIELLRQRDGANQPDVVQAQSSLAAIEKRIVEQERLLELTAAQSTNVAPRARGGVNEGVSGGVGQGVSSGVGQGVGGGAGQTIFGVTPRASSSIIGTTFTMDAGETVVVGTSRLRGGDKALIALLTAVPRGKTTGKD